MSDTDDRASMTIRIVAKQELEGATVRVLERFGMADALANRLRVERLLAKLLDERIARGQDDPMSRIRL